MTTMEKPDAAEPEKVRFDCTDTPAGSTMLPPGPAAATPFVTMADHPSGPPASVPESGSVFGP